MGTGFAKDATKTGIENIASEGTSNYVENLQVIQQGKIDNLARHVDSKIDNAIINLNEMKTRSQHKIPYDSQKANVGSVHYIDIRKDIDFSNLHYNTTTAEAYPSIPGKPDDQQNSKTNNSWKFDNDTINQRRRVTDDNNTNPLNLTGTKVDNQNKTITKVSLPPQEYHINSIANQSVVDENITLNQFTRPTIPTYSNYNYQQPSQQQQYQTVVQYVSVPMNNNYNNNNNIQIIPNNLNVAQNNYKFKDVPNVQKKNNNKKKIKYCIFLPKHHIFGHLSRCEHFGFIYLLYNFFY